VLAILYLAFSLAVTLSWQIKALEGFMPDAVSKLIYPIYKSHLAPLRLLHFLALAILVSRLTPPDWHGLMKPWMMAMIRCGENSLAIYCLGVLLSFMGFVVLSQFSSTIETKRIVRENKLVTVCEEASCPNIGECWTKKHATFMIMGDACTRACAFCNVRTGLPGPLDTDEPVKVAEAVAKLGLEHVVVQPSNTILTTSAERRLSRPARISLIAALYSRPDSSDIQARFETDSRLRSARPGTECFSRA
jgi:hypothetical protein